MASNGACSGDGEAAGLAALQNYRRRRPPCTNVHAFLLNWNYAACFCSATD